MRRVLFAMRALQVQMGHGFGEVLFVCAKPWRFDARRRRMQRFQRILDHHVLRNIARFDADIRKLVDRPSRLQQAAQGFFRIRRLQQRAVVLAAHALQQGLEIRVEPDRDAALGDPLARARIEKGAAAGGEHDLSAVQQPHDDTALAVAEIALAMLCEDFGNSHTAGRGDDFGVGVDECQAKARGETLPDGAFARAHHTHEHDRASGERGADLVDAPVICCGSGRGRSAEWLHSGHARQSTLPVREIQPPPASAANARVRKATIKAGSRGSTSCSGRDSM